MFKCKGHIENVLRMKEYNITITGKDVEPLKFFPS